MVHIVFEKLIVANLVKNLIVFYGMKSFLIVFRTRHPEREVSTISLPHVSKINFNVISSSVPTFHHHGNFSPCFDV